MFEYYDLDFARSRLEQTIIRIGGMASLITRVTGDQDLHYLDMENYEEGVVNIRDEKVSIIPPTLGYLNTGRGWHYFERTPERRWKQGVPIQLFGRELRQSSVVALGKSLNGKYTRFNVAKRAKNLVAFSPKFAICDGQLLYKEDVVGEVSVEGHTQLRERFIYLKEYLEESLK